MIRQTFYHGCYALIGEDGFPNPDYWISALYKKVVSNKVLNLTANNFPSTFKLYAHCTLESEDFLGYKLLMYFKRFRLLLTMIYKHFISDES